MASVEGTCVAEDGDISIVDGGGITELDPAGDRLLVDISGFADEWLHPLSRPISRPGNRKGPRNSGPRFPFWHASISEDRSISGARVCPLCPRKRTNSRECRHVRLRQNRTFPAKKACYSIMSSALQCPRHRQTAVLILARRGVSRWPRSDFQAALD